MANTGAQLGQTYQTIMPAFTDNADIQQAFMMLWYGDPNATGPTSKGVEYYLSQLSSSVNAVAAKKTTDVIFSATAPTRNTVDYSDWIWVDTSTTNPDGASRPINIWNGSAWSQVAGAANPSPRLHRRRAARRSAAFRPFPRGRRPSSSIRRWD